jgi:protein TonB
MAFSGQLLDLEPGEHAVVGHLFPRPISMPSDPSLVEVRIVGVTFDDGTSWGHGVGTVQSAAGRGLPARQLDEATVTPRAPSLDGGQAALIEKVIKRVQPDYPPLARAAKVSGAVAVEVVVDEAGDVVSARAISGHPLLKDAAVDAARQWKFEILIVNGKPARFVGTVTFNFQLP